METSESASPSAESLGGVTPLSASASSEHQALPPSSLAPAGAIAGTSGITAPDAEAPTLVDMPMDELRTKLQQVLASFDVDGNGAISLNEMFRAADELELGIPPEHLAELVKECDTDGSGEVDFDEFIMALRGHIAGEDGPRLGETFATRAIIMFRDLWNGFSTPLKGIDSLAQNAALAGLFAGKSRQQTEEDAAEVARKEADYTSRSSWSRTSAGTSRTARKAPTPKRVDCDWSPKRNILVRIPLSTPPPPPNKQLRTHWADSYHPPLLTGGRAEEQI
jgi:hypothetical protein